MGTRQSEQSSLWIAASDLPASPAHPFFTRLNALLDAHDFDRFVEGLCRPFYAKVMGHYCPVIAAAHPRKRLTTREIGAIWRPDDIFRKGSCSGEGGRARPGHQNDACRLAAPSSLS